VLDENKMQMPATIARTPAIFKLLLTDASGAPISVIALDAVLAAEIMSMMKDAGGVIL